MFCGDRPGDGQHVGVARRCDETQAEAFEIVERVAERMQLELAAVAGAGIDMADGERAPERARARDRRFAPARQARLRLASGAAS